MKNCKSAAAASCLAELNCPGDGSSAAKHRNASSVTRIKIRLGLTIIYLLTWIFFWLVIDTSESTYIIVTPVWPDFIYTVGGFPFSAIYDEDICDMMNL